MNSEITDPRNDEDYDTFMYGTEPIPGDSTWSFGGKNKRRDSSAQVSPESTESTD